MIVIIQKWRFTYKKIIFLINNDPEYVLQNIVLTVLSVTSFTSQNNGFFQGTRSYTYLR
jgi:hypothetical protein